MRHRWVWVAVAMLFALAGVRGAGLVVDGWLPTARGEERWFDWAWGTSEERALVPDRFRAAAPGLPSSEALLFVVEPGRGRESWLHVMTQYALPGRVVAGVEVDGGDQRTPARPEVSVVPLTAASPRSPGTLVPRPPGRVQRVTELAVLGLGCALVLATGLLLTSAAGPRRGLPELSLALPLGLSVAAPLGAVALLLGWPVWVASLAALLLAAVMRRATGRRLVPAGGGRGGEERVVTAPPRRPPLRGLELTLVLLLGLLFVLFAARVAGAPLWSWDHFAIWGMKARRIAAVGLGAHTFAGPAEAFGYANGHYPLGLPLAWIQLAPGVEPGGWLFRATHALFGGALLLLVRRGARAAGALPAVATLASCLVAASPLFWDTESLGLAEMALALWSVAATTAFLEFVAARSATLGGGSGLAWASGLLLGFLTWLKPEGLVLAILLATGLLWGTRRRPRDRAGGLPPAGVVRLAVPAALFALASAALSRAVPAPGVSFLAGDPVARLVERIPHAPEILRPFAADLVTPEWLGAWLVFAAAVVWAALGRLTLPLALAGVVAAQLAVYLGIYFVTNIDPAAHILSSFFRIAAGLLPLAMVAAAAAAGGDDKAPVARRRTPRLAPKAAPRPS